MRVLGLGLLHLCLYVGAAPAADCNSTVIPVSSPEVLGYQDRGDRCEGLFVQPVSTTGLRIVGYQWSFNNFDTGAPSIEILTPNDAVKTVAVVSIRKRQYYRMDSTFKERQFTFSSDLLNHPAIGVSPEELAVSACVDACNTLEPVLVPAVLARALPTKPIPYLILQATSELRQMRIEVTDHRTHEILMDKLALDRTVWGAWRPAEIPLGQFFDKRSEIAVKVTVQGQSPSSIDSVAAVLIAPPAN